jgi:hypothetical protein
MTGWDASIRILCVSTVCETGSLNTAMVKPTPHWLERWINIPYSRGMIHFFHPGLVKRDGASTFMCQGDEAQLSVFACEPIGKTALDLGIITSLDLVHTADR